MKTLNPNSTRLFCQLIEKMQGRDHLKIENEPFMPLTIEKLDEKNGLRGQAKTSLYSLAHYYTLNGDLMSDPEMTFLLLEPENAGEEICIYPRSFAQSDMGIYEESLIFIFPGVMQIHENMQFQHTEFADVWLGNIRDQKYLEQL